jgi:hypothetical protein
MRAHAHSLLCGGERSIRRITDKIGWHKAEVSRFFWDTYCTFFREINGRIDFELAEQNGIFHHSSKGRHEISKTANIGCEML